MSTEMSFSERAQQENWLPILELSTREVFSIMLDSTLEPAAGLEQRPPSEFTAMIGLAGSLCGLLTISCSARTAGQIASRMLGIDAENAGDQVWDALGELCNMVAGNFKNKLSGPDGRCLLSVPTVITGEGYNCHSLSDGGSFETVLLFDGAPVVIRLELHT